MTKEEIMKQIKYLADRRKDFMNNIPTHHHQSVDCVVEYTRRIAELGAELRKAVK